MTSRTIGRYRNEKPRTSATILKRLSWPCISALLFLSPRLCALEEHHRHHQDQKQYNRHRRGDRPVPVAEELCPERLADHQRGRTAEQIWNDEFANRRNEDKKAAGNHTRQRQREGNFPECCNGRRSK